MGEGWADWTKKLTGFAAPRRERTVEHAVRLVMDKGVSAHEKETALGQLHAALDVDPEQLFSRIAIVQNGDGLSPADAEKLATRAATAEANFDGLAKGTITLRESLTEMGLIAGADRMPETVEQWREALGRTVAQKMRHLTAQQDFLNTQQQMLETMREAALREIATAETRAQAKIAELATLSTQFFAGLSTQLGTPLEKLKELSFDHAQVTVAEPGQPDADGNIFVGLWQPADKNGKSLGIECETWAAPEDLRHAPVVGSGVGGLQTYNDSVTRTAALRGWHGHDGSQFANEAAITKHLQATVQRHVSTHGKAGTDLWFEPTGIDKWFIPPRSLLDGKVQNRNGDFETAFENNLFALRDTGAFQDTFTTTSGDVNARWYWSSTEHRVHPDIVWNVSFADGEDDWHHKDNFRLSCRPVRVGRVRHLVI